MAAVDEGFELRTFHHPNGCRAMPSVDSDGQVTYLDPPITLQVPVDQTDWTGVSCGSCGRDLKEVEA